MEIHNCSKYAECNDTNGSYTCTCKPGYKGDGFICTGNKKHDIKLVYNLDLFIPRKNFYFLNKFFVEFNQCDHNSIFCHNYAAECVSLNGSFGCQCKAGYRGDGFNCES